MRFVDPDRKVFADSAILCYLKDLMGPKHGSLAEGGWHTK